MYAGKHIIMIHEGIIMQDYYMTVCMSFTLYSVYMHACCVHGIDVSFALYTTHFLCMHACNYIVL